VNVTIENMTSVPKRKNLLGEEEEKTPSNPEKTILPLNQFLDQMGVEWEKKGRAVYIYPSSIEMVKKLLEKMPTPPEGEYIIIPLGTSNGYSVFIMVTERSISIRIGYGRNSIPFLFPLSAITEKLEKVVKELGLESRKNSKNLIEV
jgi:ribulose 1,5-bisphosphate synthetase/thiazole synthase